MRHIETEGPSEEKHAAWQTKARDACEAGIRKYKDTGNTPKPNAKIWADLKQLFLNAVFGGKCAYCEAKLPGANFSAHVEHYRPKKEVTEERVVVEHPGYFWLAYEWHNLLLVCEKCNTAHSEYIDGRKVSNPGKATEFPIGGSRVTRPSGDPSTWREELRRVEQPLLLNPYDDYPTKHIAFTEVGVPYAIDKCPRGTATIRICRLDRIELCADRISYARTQVRSRIHTIIEGPEQPILTGDMDYSLWMQYAVKSELARILKPSGIEIA